MYRVKRSFVLTEVLISVSLFAMLLCVMFGIFWRSTKVNETITKQRHFYEKLVVAQARLGAIISNSYFKISKDNPPFFFIEPAKNSRGQSLVFRYENEIEPSSDFLLILGCKIYVDEDDCLSVASWLHEDPIKEIPEMVRKERLLAGVESLEIELFAPPLLKNKEPKEKEVQIPRGFWVTSWPKEAEMRPALLKITAKRSAKGKEPLVFWFMIPKEIQTIIYRTK
jgi:hypothetical protein